MRSRPLAPSFSPSAIAAGRIGAEGCPPMVLLQSSKSCACAAVPLISAALSAVVRALPPKIRLGPGCSAASMATPTILPLGSVEPARVTPV